jgi:cytochrome c-type biogenesis protein CcmF
MTILIGSYSLVAAVLVAVVTLLVSLAAVRLGSEKARRAAHVGIYVLAGLFGVSSAALLTATVSSDFRLEYVASYTEQALPLGYKMAAFWAGQQGSLLLWGLMLAVMSVVFALQHRKSDKSEPLVAIGVLAVVLGFFAALMLFVKDADPFQPANPVMSDGKGMNPMLQDPGMIIHPPLLFLGYAGFTLPFALLIGSLFTGKVNEWIERSRAWVVMSWMLLGAGILWGSEWAYVELGWGGYWGWDPVENASLLPWLTGTALMHSIIVHRQRGMFKRWSAMLAAVTFLLCIFAAYITRSGIVQSVHSFGESPIGTVIWVFLILMTLLTVGLLAWRWMALKPERTIDEIVSRESAFLVGNVLFVLMMVVTMWGTVLGPVVIKAIRNESRTFNQGFYNAYVLPLAILMMAAMGLAPLLGFGRQISGRIVRGLMLPAVLAVSVIVTLLALGIYSLWAWSTAAVCSLVIGGIITDVVRMVWTRQQNAGETALAATLRVLDANHRRYGGYIVHAGMALVVAGIAGSSLYNTDKAVQMVPGDTATVGRYHLKLESVNQVRGPNYEAAEATLTVTPPSGEKEEMRVQKRRYDKWPQPTSEVAIRSNWREDLFVTLAGVEEDWRTLSLQVKVNPLVCWLWIGGMVMAVGGVFCLVPRFLPQAAAVPVEQAVASGKPARRMKVVMEAAN